jgi:hypothetical protein
LELDAGSNGVELQKLHDLYSTIPNAHSVGLFLRANATTQPIGWANAAKN